MYDAPQGRGYNVYEMVLRTLPNFLYRRLDVIRMQTVAASLCRGACARRGYKASGFLTPRNAQLEDCWQNGWATAVFAPKAFGATTPARAERTTVAAGDKQARQVRESRLGRWPARARQRRSDQYVPFRPN